MLAQAAQTQGDCSPHMLRAGGGGLGAGGPHTLAGPGHRAACCAPPCVPRQALSTLPPSITAPLQPPSPLHGARLLGERDLSHTGALSSSQLCQLPLLQPHKPAPSSLSLRFLSGEALPAVMGPAWRGETWATPSCSSSPTAPGETHFGPPEASKPRASPLTSDMSGGPTPRGTAGTGPGLLRNEAWLSGDSSPCLLSPILTAPLGPRAPISGP